MDAGFGAAGDVMTARKLVTTVTALTGGAIGLPHRHPQMAVANRAREGRNSDAVPSFRCGVCWRCPACRSAARRDCAWPAASGSRRG